MAARAGAVVEPVPDRPNLLAGENLPPAPRQRRSIQRRARLTTAALGLFRENGYDATSIEDIANHAGMAVGGVYLHFRSKRQLLLSLMDDLLAALARLALEPAPNQSPKAMLRDLLSRGFKADLLYLGAYRAWSEAVLSDPDLARKEQQIRKWTTARAALLFRQLGQLNHARQKVEVDDLARVLDSLFWNLVAQAARSADDELERSIDATTHLVYHALFVDPSPKRGRR